MSNGFPIQNPVLVTVDTAGTRVQLSSTATLVRGLYVEADEDNTGKIYVGDANVSSTRYTTVLSANEGWEWSNGDGQPKLDISSVWFDASANSQEVHYSYW